MPEASSAGGFSQGRINAQLTMPATNMAEPVTIEEPYSGSTRVGMSAVSAAPRAASSPTTRPSGEMESCETLPPVAMRNVPTSASTRPAASRRRGERCRRTQVTTMMMTSCRHCSTVAVPALVRRTAMR